MWCVCVCVMEISSAAAFLAALLHTVICRSYKRRVMLMLLCSFSCCRSLLPPPFPPPHLTTAFLEPEAVQLLVDKFNIKGADTAHPLQEVERMMGGN